jgi:hypothetical protein
MTTLQATVALCAGAGFLIVWLVFPSKNAKIVSAREGEGAAAGASSSKPPPEDEPEFEEAYDEPPRAQPTDGSYRPRWCDILLLEPDASPAAIRKAYARLMKGLHPDVAGADEHTSRQCSLVQEAYQQAMQDRRA